MNYADNSYAGLSDRDAENLEDEAGFESFPASDPPVWTSLHAGAPKTGPAVEQEEGGLVGALRAHVIALSPSLEERQAVAHARDVAPPERIVDGVVAALRRIGAGALVRRPLPPGHPSESIELDLAGQSARDEIVVVGAHYDASPNHDNVSGMAVLLELARRAAARSARARTVRFVFFPRGELPRSRRAELGSRLYAEAARARGEQIVGMIALECLGCRAPGVSRGRTPLVFPSAGLVFVGNIRSRALAQGAARIFREASPVPVHVVSVPGGVPVLRTMDHWAFWKAGYPAFAVTDTWPLRDRRFCTPAHSPERLDLRRMARGVPGVEAIVAALAGV